MDWVGWTSLGIVGLGLILFFILATKRSYKRHPAVEHYKDARDELSGVEPVDDEKSQGVPGIGGLFGIIPLLITGVITLTIGTSVLDSVQNTMNTTSTGELGGALETVLNISPLFLAIALFVPFIIVISRFFGD